MRLLISAPPAPEHETRPAVCWEDAACPLCGGRHTSLLMEGQDPLRGADGLCFAVVQCDACGLCYTNPRPDADTIGGFYRADYGPHREVTIAKPRGRFARRRPETTPIPWNGRGRLLDFGCGSGEYLALMKGAGWRVTGLDASEQAATRARHAVGASVYVGSLPHPDLSPESFDAITMWHVLEHVHDPLGVLRAVRELLAPGGLAYIACPNIDSWAFRWFGAAWYGLDLPRHLTHFTSPTLTQMLEKAGFRVESVKLVRHSDWLRNSARRRSALPGASLWQRAIATKYGARIGSWLCHLANRCDGLFAVAARP